MLGRALPSLALLTLITAFVATPAQAQPRAPARPAPPPPQPAAPAAPPAVEVVDPMLAPVAPAPKVLTNWKMALQLIQTRSIDIATAVQEVEKAEGNLRVSLAVALPSLTGTLTATGQLITSPKSAGGLLPVPGVIVPGVANNLPQTVLFTQGLGQGGTGASGTNPTALAALQASMPIFAPRAWYAIRTAELGVHSNKLTLEDKKRTIFTAVAAAIIQVFTAERTAEINRQGLKSALQVLDLTKRQNKLGVGTKIDVLRAEQSAQTARAALVAGDESLRQNRESLGVALGFPEAYGVPQNISLDEMEGTLKAICAPSPLEDRADIKKLRNDVEIARRAVNDVWLQFSPTATLSSTASLQNSPQAVSGQIGAWNIVGVLTVPFWEGGARYGNLRVTRAAHEEAKLQLELATRNASIQITQALRNVAVAEQERTVSASSRDLAKELAALTKHAYELGTATSFDLVNTEQTWRAAELDLVVKEFNVVQAKLSAVLAKSNCSY
jgi:outer membrane protein TolC